MIAFWIVAGVLSAAAAGLVLQRAAAARAGSDDKTLPVYQRQLAEIGDLAARGLIAEPERRGAEAEAGRRLLTAAGQSEPPWTTTGRKGALAAAVIAPLLAAGLYFVVGAPGDRDQPFAARLAAWRAADPATLAPAQMAAILQHVTHEQPKNAEAFRYLAIAYAASGDAPQAIHALKRAVTLAPERVELWEMLGEMLTAQADGVATPEARAAFRQALARDPQSVAARFHLGRARIMDGDASGGLADLRALLTSLRVDDERRPALASAIAQLEARPAAPPAQPQIEAMVAGLAARLEAQPNDPEGWVRLVRSYAVLGDGVRRDAALKRAQGLFGKRPEVMSRLAEAARAEPMR